MARRLARLFGVALVGVAGAMLVVDFGNAISGGALNLTTLGDLLFLLCRDLVERFQVAVQAHVSTTLWDSVIAPILRLPVAFGMGLPGVVLLAIGFRPRRSMHGRGKKSA